ncbi:trypsin-like serine peptidase [Peredibacter starrii]|uniref:Trypsin n=1 Tax=Peredibacter starrii TaxID=28202 RepID=A0AAX4HLE3_9BACT|nr:hypothetical protein [Peredibacter starrii]WPU64079.1 hypothetical protein SOO65_15400 [Peredibacter starrii]
MKFLIMSLIALTSINSFADICGQEDDRAPSFDTRVGRMVKADETRGCAATLVSNNCVITIGTCAVSRDYVEFNVPQSIAGIPQTSAIKDRYYIDHTFVRYETGGIGQNWAVMKLKKNEVTDLDAGQVQGYYKVATKKSLKNSTVKLISYAYALNDLYEIKIGEVPPNKYPEVLHFSQGSSTGKLVKSGLPLIPAILEHTADTTIGSWGAPIIDEKSNEVIGITTHGGCRATYINPIGARFTNSGTSITGSKKFKEAVNKCMSI